MLRVLRYPDLASRFARFARVSRKRSKLSDYVDPEDFAQIAQLSVAVKKPVERARRNLRSKQHAAAQAEETHESTDSPGIDSASISARVELLEALVETSNHEHKTSIAEVNKKLDEVLSLLKQPSPV